MVGGMRQSAQKRGWPINKRLLKYLVVLSAVLYGSYQLLAIYFIDRIPILAALSGRSGFHYSQETYVVRKVLEEYYSKYEGEVPTIRKWKRRSRITLAIPRYFFSRSKDVFDNPDVISHKGYISTISLHFCYPHSSPDWPCVPRRRNSESIIKSYRIGLSLEANSSGSRVRTRNLNNSIRNMSRNAKRPDGKFKFQQLKSDLKGFNKYVYSMRITTNQTLRHEPLPDFWYRTTTYVKRDTEGKVKELIKCKNKPDGQEGYVSCGIGIDIDNRLQVGYGIPGALWPQWRQLDRFVEKLVRSWVLKIEKYNTHLGKKWGLDK